METETGVQMPEVMLRNRPRVPDRPTSNKGLRRDDRRRAGGTLAQNGNLRV